MSHLKEWQIELKFNIKTNSDLCSFRHLYEDKSYLMNLVQKEFPVSITRYYANLINWEDPHDPLLRMVMPSIDELSEIEKIKKNSEKANLSDNGIIMKYASTLLLIPMMACFAHCRFCFRRRLFKQDVRKTEVVKLIDNAVGFIKANPAIDNVLITGGDPFILETDVLRHFLKELRKIDHVRIIRFGTRVLAYLPCRITTDQELIEVLHEFSSYNRRVYIISHFNHPRELTYDAGVAVGQLLSAGVILSSQTVMLRGVNDSVIILRSLFNRLAEWGIVPYYLFQCRPVICASHFVIPLHKLYDIYTEAMRSSNGLAKRVRLVMSHQEGKIEIIGTELYGNQRHFYLKFHGAVDKSKTGKIICIPLSDDECWPDIPFPGM